MDFSPFKQDIDELIQEFAQGQLATLSDMKRIWLDRKFSYIFQALPSANLAVVMQTLYNRSISYMDINKSLSDRLGALYCLYCLYETQPFKPPFKIYLSLGELEGLGALVVAAKERGIKVVSTVVKKMLEKNAFLIGFVSISEYSGKERMKGIVDTKKACLQLLNEKLLGDTDTEGYLHMDMGMVLDLEELTKISKEYEALKGLAIKEASKVGMDVKNIEHIAQERETIGDEVRKITEEWGNQREAFSQQLSITPPEKTDLQQEQPMSLPSTQSTLDDYDNDLQHTSFLDLLGNKSPQLNSDVQRNFSDRDIGANDEDDDNVSEFAKELESELFLDF